jgi:hypothetical protein
VYIIRLFPLGVWATKQMFQVALMDHHKLWLDWYLYRFVHNEEYYTVDVFSQLWKFKFI